MLGSMAALRAVPLVPGYGSAKAGILSLTRNLPCGGPVTGSA